MYVLLELTDCKGGFKKSCIASMDFISYANAGCVYLNPVTLNVTT